MSVVYPPVDSAWSPAGSGCPNW